MVLPQKMQQCRLNDSRFYLNPKLRNAEKPCWWFSPGYCTSHRIGRCHPRTLLLKNQHQGLVNVPWLGDFVEHHSSKWTFWEYQYPYTINIPEKHPTISRGYGSKPCRQCSVNALSRPRLHNRPHLTVGGIPTRLKHMSSSVGMMTFPIYGKS